MPPEPEITLPEPEIIPDKDPEPEIIPEIEPEIEIDERTRIEHGILLGRVGGAGEEKDRELPPGSIAWKQGFDWKYIPPPYDQVKPISLGRTAPIGAVRNTGSNRPVDTVQVIGSVEGIPQDIAVDLGFVDVIITGGDTIEFVSGGLKTNVGKRINSPTKGMSVHDMGVSVIRTQGEEEMEAYRPVEPITLPEMPEVDVEPEEQEDDLSDITSISPEEEKEMFGTDDPPEEAEDDLDDLFDTSDPNEDIYSGRPASNPARRKKIVRRYQPTYPGYPTVGGIR